MGEHPRLARPGAGHDQQRAVDVGDGLELVRVETVDGRELTLDDSAILRAGCHTDRGPGRGGGEMPRHAADVAAADWRGRGAGPGGARPREALRRRARRQRRRRHRRARRAGRVPRAQRRRQDHHAADAAGRDHARRGHDRDLRSPPAPGSLQGHGARRLRRRLPAAARAAPGAARRSASSPASTACATSERGRRRGPRTLRHPAPRRPAVQRAVVGPAHRSSASPRPILHRPRLLVLDEPTASLDPDVAQRVRDRAARRVRRGRHRAARHQPRHARGRDPRRAGRVPGPRPGRRRRHAGRHRRPLRPRRPRRRVPLPAPAPSRRSADEHRAASPPSCAATSTCCGAARTASSTSPSGRCSTCLLFGSLGAYVAPAGRRHEAGAPYLLAGILHVPRPVPDADRHLHRLHGGDVEPQPAERDDHAGHRGRVHRRRRRLRAGEAGAGDGGADRSSRSRSSASTSTSVGWGLVPDRRDPAGGRAGRSASP